MRHSGGPAKAVQSLELLLDAEANNPRNIILKPGVVFNLFKACSLLDDVPPALVARLEHIATLLQANSRLWDLGMAPFIVGLLGTSSPNFCEAFLDGILGQPEGTALDMKIFHQIMNEYIKHKLLLSAQRLVERVEQMHQSGRLKNGPDIVLYTQFLTLLAKQTDRPSLEKAKELIRRMEASRDRRPDLIAYTLLLRCYANRGMLQEVEDLLKQMYNLHESGQLKDAPDSAALRCVRDARRHWNKYASRTAGRSPSPARGPSRKECTENITAIILATEVGRLNQETRRNATDAIWFHIHQHPDKNAGGKQALLLLNRLLEEAQARNDDTVLQQGIIFNILRACQTSNCIRVDDLESTLRLLEQQRSLDTKILTELLRAVTRCQDPDAPDRAKTILLKRASGAQLNTYHFNAVLNGYAKRGGYDKKAERLLNEMQRLHGAGNITDAPNTISHNIVLDALSKSRENDAVERAEAMLRRMEQNPQTRPDMFSFTSLFNLYSKNAEGDKAERLLDRVIGMEEAGALREKPNALTYRCVIDALATSGEEPDRAEQILNLMSERGCLPNKFHYCGVLSAYARAGRAVDCERLLQQIHESHRIGDLKDAPGVELYNCAIYAWARSNNDDAHFRARAVLDKMVELGVSPNVISYNCLLCACAGLGKETELILKQMHELHSDGVLEAPTLISYNYVLDSLARSGDREWTVMRAESLIQQMKELHKSGIGDTKPNMISYRSLLKCYANWRLEEDAENLLERMQKMSDKGKLDSRPGRIAYSIVVNLLRKSKSDGAKERAAILEKHVEEMYGDEETLVPWSVENDQLEALLGYMAG